MDLLLLCTAYPIYIRLRYLFEFYLFADWFLWRQLDTNAPSLKDHFSL